MSVTMTYVPMLTRQKMYRMRKLAADAADQGHTGGALNVLRRTFPDFHFTISTVSEEGPYEFLSVEYEEIRVSHLTGTAVVHTEL